MPLGLSEGLSTYTADLLILLNDRLTIPQSRQSRASPLCTRGPDEVCAVWEFLRNCVAGPHKESEGYAMLCGTIGNVCGGYEALQLT